MVYPKQECYFPALPLEPSGEGLTDQWFVKPNPKTIRGFLKKKHASDPIFPSPLRPEELQDTPQDCRRGESRVPVRQSLVGTTWKIFLKFSKISNSEWTWNLYIYSLLWTVTESGFQIQFKTGRFLVIASQKEVTSDFSGFHGPFPPPQEQQERRRQECWEECRIQDLQPRSHQPLQTSSPSHCTHQGPLPKMPQRSRQVRCIRWVQGIRSKLSSVWPGTALG